jgi:hypothetical protein
MGKVHPRGFVTGTNPPFRVAGWGFKIPGPYMRGGEREVIIPCGKTSGVPIGVPGFRLVLNKIIRLSPRLQCRRGDN